MPIHSINPHILPSITTVLKVYIILFYRVGLATLLGQQGERDIVNCGKGEEVVGGLDPGLDSGRVPWFRVALINSKR